MMEERTHLQIFLKEGPEIVILLTCYVAMESRKVIMCGGLKLYPSGKGHAHTCTGVAISFSSLSK